MPDQESERVINLTRRLIAVDSRSAVASAPVFDLAASELAGWQIEYIDYADAKGTPKRNLVARCGTSRSPVAFAGHLDTVPDTGWKRKPFEATIEGELLYGLGSSDMKGPIASFITAANSLPADMRPMLVLTSDEEAGKQGAREVVARSSFLRDTTPRCFVVAEPTALGVLRGHRVDVAFTVNARGIQAHSSTGKGRNANLALIPFLSDMRDLHFHLREDPSLHDCQYDPPYADLNFVIDNYGAFPNTTVGLATCRIKFRYSKSFDPNYVIERVRASAAKHALELDVVPEAPPPELPPDHALVRSAEAILGGKAKVAGLGTEASEYSKLAPCLVFGPGDIDHAHKPTEYIDLRQLTGSTELYRQLARNLLA
ncbi:MAG: Acetylornithine deacetylase [Ramlibacter sp.]|nr:Acetylornithine deacetylase [Ramlibacter sp.]